MYILVYTHIYLYMMRKNMKTNIRINCVNLRDHLTSLGFKCCLCEAVMNKKGLAGMMSIQSPTNLRLPIGYYDPRHTMD